jgi:hypothetical protein
LKGYWKEIDMQIRSAAVSLSVGLFSSVLAVAVFQYFETNHQSVFAQEVTPSCPLPPDIAITFLGSQCKKVKLQMPQTFFRYYSNENNKKGRFLTTDQYQTNVEVITKLALNQAWGNKAEKMLSITLPAGTIVYEGIVAPQNPSSCYPGGGQQTFIEDSKGSNLFWTEGPTLTSQPFKCP